MRKSTHSLEQADLNQLANAQKRAKPTRDPAQLMERLDIFVRAGDRRQADLILQALGHTALAQDTFQGGVIADFLIQHGEWDLARHLIDICPRIDIYHVDYVMQVSPPPHPDRWIAAHERLYPDSWTPISIGYHLKRGTLHTLLYARAAEISAHPHDLSRIDSYLMIARSFKRPPNIAWLASTCDFPLAIENLEMGHKLFRSPDLAILFLQRSLQTPVTYADYRWLKRNKYSLPMDAQGKPDLKAISLYAKSLLMRHYKTVQQAENAQRLQAEIAAQAPQGLRWSIQHIYPPFSPTNWGGGGFRSNSYTPVAGSDPESDYRYWLDRADTYLGQKERAQANQAYQKALELTAAHPGANSEDRIRVMHRYLNFLYDAASYSPRVDWLRSELAKTPFEGDYAPALIDQLLSIIPVHNPGFHAVEETFWSYLAARKTWQKQEEQVLNSIIPYQSAERDRAWARAVQLTQHDPNRERVLGARLKSMGEWSRALSVLQDVARQTGSADDHRVAARLALDLAISGDWPQAKALWPEVRSGLMESEATEYLHWLLSLAIENKAPEDAMGLFTEYVRHDHNIFHTSGDTWRARAVTDMAYLGLRERLRRFYSDMALADPDSHVPQDSIPVLLEAREPQSRTLNGHINNHLSLHLKNQDLTSVLQRICDQSQIRSMFALQGSTTHKVTLDLNKVVFPEAVQRILDAASPSPPLHIVWSYSVMVVCPVSGSPKLSASTSVPLADRLKFRMTAHLYDIDVWSALAAFHEATGVDENTKDMAQVQQPEVKIDCVNVPAHTLLEKILKQTSSPSSYWLQDNVLWIGLRDNAPQEKAPGQDLPR